MGMRFHDAIIQFEKHSRARGLEDRTVRNRVQPLRKGMDIIGNLTVANISGRHIDQIFSNAGWQASTANQYQSSFRLFFDWCRANRVTPLNHDPMVGWKPVRVERKEKLRIPVDEFNDFLEAADHPYDRMVVALAMYTLCRGSELTPLKFSDIIDLDSKKPLLSIYRCKGKEADVIPIPEELQDELHIWMRWLTANAGIVQSDWYILGRRDNNGGVDPTLLSRRPYRAVQRVLKKLGYPIERNGVHTLRRSSSRAAFDLMRDNGYDGALLRVSSMLGHRGGTRITEKYIGLELEREQRNEQFAGKVMFPNAKPAKADVIDFPAQSGS